MGRRPYLIYLGYSAIKDSPTDAEDMRAIADERPTTLNTVRQGFMVGALNPKGMVFFAAIVPQFVDCERGSVTIQMIVMATVRCDRPAIRWQFGSFGRNYPGVVCSRY
jgi:threonine/homoserine/homoserine lactone efflux protein